MAHDLINLLKSQWSQGKLPGSILISTNNTQKALASLLKFAEILLSSSHIETHPDFFLINLVKEKNISIEQIRDLRSFFNLKASKYKIAIINGADLMSVNAQNSSLKLLEDLPNNSYIFLISTNSDSLLDTVKSRLYKIIINYEIEESKELYENIVRTLIFNHPKFQKPNIDKFVDNIHIMLDKKVLDWQEICSQVRIFLLRIIKCKLHLIKDSYFKDEDLILEALTAPIENLLKFYEDINNFLNNSSNHDLDKKQFIITLSHKFSNLI